MTLKEEAYAIIERLPDKVMGDILKELKKTEANPRTWETPEQEQAREAKELEERREALRRLKEMMKVLVDANVIINFLCRGRTQCRVQRL